MVDKRYFIPDDIEEARSLKAEGGGKASYLAGGTYLNWGPTKDEPTTYIDLKRVVGRNIMRNGNSLSLGALISLQTMADDTQLPGVLRRSAGEINSRQVRNQATLGGNIGANRPDSNLIPPLLALGARIRLGGGDEISLSNWLADPSEAPITQLVIALPARRVETARVSRSANACPVITVAITLDPEPMVVVGGALSAITRLRDLEQALGAEASPPPGKIEELVKGELPVESDIHGSAEYKRYIAAVTIVDTVARCRHKEG